MFIVIVIVIVIIIIIIIIIIITIIIKAQLICISLAPWRQQVAMAALLPEQRVLSETPAACIQLVSAVHSGDFGAVCADFWSSHWRFGWGCFSVVGHHGFLVESNTCQRTNYRGGCYH